MDDNSTSSGSPYESTSSFEEDDDLDEIFIAHIMNEYEEIFLCKTPQRTSILSGAQFDCIGAIDGTRISAWVPSDGQTNFREGREQNGKDLEGLCGEEDLLGQALRRRRFRWLIEQLTKAIKMKIFMGFNRKFRGKTRVHLLEVSFNVHGRFIRLSKFTSNRKSTFLVIPEGDNGRGWELLKSVLYSMLVVPSSSFDENGSQSREGRILHKNIGPLQRSYANVVRDEGPRKGGLVPVGRWVRVVVCECQDGVVNWAESDEKMDAKGKFRSRGEIKGRLDRFKRLPFHLWSKVHLKKIMEQWGTVTEIVWRTLKLFYLSKARVKVVMKERSVLPALIEVLDGGWDFTVSIAVAVKEDDRQVREMGESTRQLAEAHMGTVGKTMEDRSRSEPLTTKRSKPVSDTLPLEDVPEAGTQLVQGCSEEGTTPTKENAEQRNLLRAPFHGSSVTDHLSYPATREKGLNFEGSPHGAPILGTVSQEDTEFSQMGGFQIEGLSPSKMAKVCEVLSSLDIKNPDVVMFQETKREVCDRKFVESVWLVRNKEWAALPACGASEDFNHLRLKENEHLQEVLPRWTSDHWPIVLDTNPFKWGQHLLGLRICGCNIIVSKSALAVGGENLKEMVGKVTTNIDANEQEGALSSDLLFKDVRKGELEEIIMREEIHWRQKAKGLVLDNSESITEEILLYFKKLYSSPPGESWRVEGIDWSPISEESASRLDSPFSEVEIYNAIFQLDRDKASGPDGFTIAVFQDCWDVIKDDLVRVFAEFHNTGLLIKTPMLLHSSFAQKESVKEDFGF
ncbi:hypothetical protein CK203_025219 [Vitis vinifera]|uniref:DUF4283 domain-containing protein n=1 Tax=Vitis vinifera TaxID=29760 RepID=A0A438JEZ0_VITVI|nr:hypothetical protein CK203_025219 [Vitis vinifera]